MKSLVIVILLLILLMIWILMTKKKLVVMDENVNLAMGQLGVQVSSQFDAAMLLVDLVESYTEKDGSRLKKMIQTEYRILTARSMPSDVLKQERVIQKVLDEISDISGKYPELKEDRGYVKCLDAVESYKKMVRTSRLIYNDIVTKYNQAIRMVETMCWEDTFNLGKKIGQQAKPGQVICLNGDLGVGKTVFTQGFAKGLGIEETVNSPTFTIIQVYDEGRIPLYHFDVYRIGDPEEMYEIGYEDYFFGEGVCLIEWSKLIEELIPSDAATVLIEKDLEKGLDYRKVTVEGL